jgi:hypothetical protein
MPTWETKTTIAIGLCLRWMAIEPVATEHASKTCDAEKARKHNTVRESDLGALTSSRTWQREPPYGLIGDFAKALALAHDRHGAKANVVNIEDSFHFLRRY